MFIYMAVSYLKQVNSLLSLSGQDFNSFYPFPSLASYNVSNFSITTI